MALDKTTKQNIRLLRLQVEEAAHRKMRTPADFFFLSERMQGRIGESLSVSTLKRLWGYVGGYETPRFATLSILSRFLGYTDWDDFVTRFCSNPEADAAEIILKDCLFSHDLALNECIMIAWNPNRRCELRYLGDYKFVVESSEHSNLAPGDQFRCPFFILHQPLYIAQLTTHDQKVKSKVYVIGRNGGLTAIEKV